MALSGWDFSRNEELFTDKLVEEGINLLISRYDKMADWIENNVDYNKCEECGSENITYRHDGILCEECDHLHKEKVPYPAQGGTVASRKLVSVLKELFSLKMGEKRKNEKPKEKDLKELEYSVDKFDTGEYSKEEAEFLKKRFDKLLKQNKNGDKGADPQMIRSMVIKELQIQNMERKEAAGMEVDRMKMKDLYNIYMKISSKLKFTKDTRENDDEENALLNLISENEQLEADLDIDEDIKEFMNNYDNIIEYRKEAKKRKEEVGNPYG